MTAHDTTKLVHLSTESPSLLPRKVQHGEEEVRVTVCTEAMDFMEGMRDGWNGLIPPVTPNLVSFNIIIKVSPRTCVILLCVCPRCAQQGEIHGVSGDGQFLILRCL